MVGGYCTFREQLRIELLCGVRGNERQAVDADWSAIITYVEFAAHRAKSVIVSAPCIFVHGLFVCINVHREWNKQVAGGIVALGSWSCTLMGKEMRVG